MAPVGHLAGDGTLRRVWKPLDIRDGMRLYKVALSFLDHQESNYSVIVAAKSPSHAAELMRGIWKDDNVIVTGHALNVYIPEDWWENGI